MLWITTRGRFGDPNQGEMRIMPGKKILMLTGDFSEEYEIFVFEQAMHAVGHIVHVVCPDKKAGDVLKTSLHDFEGDQSYTEKPGHNYILNKTFSAVQPAEYDALYVAGGRGPEYIRIDKRVQDIVRHFHSPAANTSTCRLTVRMWTEPSSRPRGGRGSPPSCANA
jgi:putative intracellular protease/amidase